MVSAGITTAWRENIEEAYGAQEHWRCARTAEALRMVLVVPQPPDVRSAAG